MPKILAFVFLSISIATSATERNPPPSKPDATTSSGGVWQTHFIVPPGKTLHTCTQFFADWETFIGFANARRGPNDLGGNGSPWLAGGTWNNNFSNEITKQCSTGNRCVFSWTNSSSALQEVWVIGEFKPSIGGTDIPWMRMNWRQSAPIDGSPRSVEWEFDKATTKSPYNKASVQWDITDAQQPGPSWCR